MYEASGKIKLIYDTQTFASGFTKREFVLTTANDRYPQDLKFEVVKDKCSMLEQFEPEQEVVVSFDIRGNEYNGKYYVNLACWKIQAADAKARGGRDDFGDEAFASGPSSAGRNAGGGNKFSASPAARKPTHSQASGQPRAEEEPSLADLRDENDFDDDIPF